MKKLFFILFLLFSLNVYAQIKVEGIYQGENLIINNPFAPTGVGFCIFEVNVNGSISTDEISSSTFEIDFKSYNLKLGDPVTIEIKHQAGCTPQIANQEVLSPKSTYDVKDIYVDRASGKLIWITTNERGELDYAVQQFRWNKWITIATVRGKGTYGPNTYSVPVKPHSGLNKFRVSQTDYTKQSRISKYGVFRSMDPTVTFSPKNPTSTITFSDATAWEIYDNRGQFIKKGYGTTADISKLKKGDYFLNFDNSKANFTKK